jgi:hypothetical protein
MPAYATLPPIETECLTRENAQRTVLSLRDDQVGRVCLELLDID